MSLEQTIDNLQIRNANMVTFVGTSNTMVDTTTGRIQTKGIQHNSNVITDVSGPHGRIGPTLKKYPEIIFDPSKVDGNDTTNTYIQAGYVVSSSTKYTTYSAIKAFDDTQSALGVQHHWSGSSAKYNTSDGDWSGDTASVYTTNVEGVNKYGEWLQIEFPHKIKYNYSAIKGPHDYAERQPRNGYILGSNDLSGQWTTLHRFTGVTRSSATRTVAYTPPSAPTNAFKYIRLVIEAITASNGQYAGVDEWNIYGYEEDPPAGDHSVDTTFKSRFNNPQTTGVQVLVDGATGVGTNQISGGPDPSGNQSTYVTDGKYWTLNGTLTSNLSVEANTFLEGDQPHAVSVWFNSSNLEANVSNTCVFSIASEEKLDSVNLDLQSNTWHNLTYAYQGEGGSRVTYLDGRKLPEDQAEDTFGEYPPFNMTGYSQGGYVISASSELGTAYLAHEAFNGTFADNGDCWLSGNSVYDSGTGTYNGNANLGSDSGGPAFANADKGEWLKLEMPHKFVVDYISICGSTATGVNPKDWKIYGSNDDKNWDVLLSKTNAITAAYNASSGKEHVVGASKAYKYFALVVTKSGGLSGNHYIQVGELEFYGHRENDLVRLPDPTHVLKYPHIAMTGPARRGYVVTTNTELASTTAAWKAFDGNNGVHWQTANGTFGTSGDFSAVSGQTFAGYTGHWVKLELPHKIELTRFKIKQFNHANQQPKDYVLLGSNNDSTWTLIHAETAANMPGGVSGGTEDVTSFSAGTPAAYKYIKLLVRKLEGSGGSSAGYMTIDEIEYYGTGVDSIPIQIGGGNIDKVANFRVYDKFIEEDQVNEIWNAQKEEFGRAKPRMVLQQGKLGIGTDAPQGSLSVADEPHNLEEFPPRAMTDYKTYFEGHGEFCTSASTWYNQASSSSPIYPWNAFNKGALGFSTGDGHGNNWEGSSADYSSSTGLYTGSINTAGINGDWVQLELPYTIKLDYMELMPMYYNDGTHSNIGPARSPQDGHIMASNDGINWISIYNWTGRTDFKNLEYTRFKVPGTVTKAYKYFRIVWTRTNYTAPDGGSYSGYAAGGEIKFFGTREQGQSILRDGQLTLTKSLNVPRIGPPLDADDTPRRDRLVVEYNTSTNPTFEGAVRDTSGRGNDGMFYGGASYDANEKALVFDGNGDYLEHDANFIDGINALTMSIWVNPDTVGNNWRGLIKMGDNSSGNSAGLYFAGQVGGTANNGKISFTTYGNNLISSKIPNVGNWIHICGTYDGTTRRLYADGVQISTDTATINLTGTSKEFIIGGASPTTEFFAGKISSFKLYDVALTAEEVKTLYDMGRCDEGHHVVNFSKTRVGIGLGDGKAPRGTLDVRGETPFIGPGLVIDQNASGNWGSSGQEANMNGLLLTRTGESGLTGSNYWNISAQHTGAGSLLFSLNGAQTAYLDTPGVGAIDFTGQHRTFIKDIPFSRAGELEGLIVSSDQNKYIKINNGIETGSNAILINESLPVVSLSNTVMDKKCFGVISASEDPEERRNVYGCFVTPFEKEKGDTRVYINSVGEGAIWVVNTNGSLESGDYITTSNVAGYGQKQDDDVLHNYTVSKITMDCDFEPATQPVQRILRSNVVQTYYLGDVHHVKSVPYEIITTEEGESNVVYDTKYTLTTTANVTESDSWDNVFIDPPEVTYATYSNLEANVQSTYTLTFTQTTTDEKTPTEWSALESNVQSLYNKVYYESVEEEVAADYPGAVAHTRVTDKIENTLDEYGQIQWEDHPTETEKAYKVRYLTADGNQTDEANAVHIAAFVGCTYHCG